MELHLDSTADLPRAARTLLEFAGEVRVIVFNGEIGAGKTTFIQQICRELGVREAVTSPTFSIVNEYHTERGDRVFHLDLYRLEQTAEAQDIGIEEYFYSEAYCFVEWPDISLGLLPEQYISVEVEIQEGNRRKMVFLKNCNSE